ncbi:phage minor tail protein L, partial [Escherichia coli]|nr:phage minor tail protein L [Escherichia coli]
MFPEHYASKRLNRTVLIFTERPDQLFRVTDRVPG